MRFEWLSGSQTVYPELIHHEGGAGDTIALVFTGEELSEFVSDPALHGELSDWLAASPDTALLHDPASSADARTPEIAYLDLAHDPAYVIYGAPPGIDPKPANDEAGYASSGDLDQFFYGGTDGAVTEYQDKSPKVVFGQSDESDALLGALGDGGLHGAGGEDFLDAVGRLDPQTAGADGNTFLLTDLNIADLIGDYDQARHPGLAGGDAELFDHYLAAAQSPPAHAGPGTITIEIEDGSGTATAHILA